MFEVGFSEIVLILGLALLVLGPEKLPRLAEKVGRWTGRARAMARQLRTQLEQEVTLDEMTRSRSMQPPAPETATPPHAHASTTEGSTAEVSTTQADPTVTAQSAEQPTGQPDSDQPHNDRGLDLQTMVSGMEPPPQSAAETPANKAVQ